MKYSICDCDNAIDARVPTLPCRICGKECSGAYEYKHLGGIDVCYKCGDIIANIYSKKHSGQYLTWQNPKDETSKKKKAISYGLRTKVFERDRYRCVFCGSHEKLNADHIHPESRGGETTIENLQTLCKPCNSRKGAKISGGVK